jgi:nucleoid-associated protein YgaU
VKFWIPALCLLGLFALAAVWQTRWRADLRAEHESAWHIDEPAAPEEPPPGAFGPVEPDARQPAPAGDGWSRVIVGRPSGVEPLLPIEAPQLPRAAPREGRDAALGAARHEVQRGESLSVICQRHYGSARPSLVRALASYNGLADPDDLRAGRVLELPPVEALLER